VIAESFAIDSAGPVRSNFDRAESRVRKAQAGIVTLPSMVGHFVVIGFVKNRLGGF
jgi:hypothetical protein